MQEYLEFQITFQNLKKRELKLKKKKSKCLCRMNFEEKHPNFQISFKNNINEKDFTKISLIIYTETKQQNVKKFWCCVQHLYL